MKQFFEQYGSVALGILALLVLIAMITPVGNIIKTSLQGTVQTFSTSINAQVNDDLNAVSKIQANIENAIPYNGNLVNLNGQNSFASTYTNSDIVFPSMYDFKDSITIYAEVDFSEIEVNSSSYMYIFGNWEGAGGGIALENGNLRGMLLFEGDSAYTRVSMLDYAKDEVNRIAMTYDGETMKLYVNGILKDSIMISKNIAVSALPFVIGNPEHSNTRNSLPNAKIYRVAVYDGALTPEQIESLQYK